MRDHWNCFRYFAFSSSCMTRFDHQLPLKYATYFSCLTLLITSVSGQDLMVHFFNSLCVFCGSVNVRQPVQLHSLLRFHTQYIQVSVFVAVLFNNTPYKRIVLFDLFSLVKNRLIWCTGDTSCWHLRLNMKFFRRNYCEI